MGHMQIYVRTIGNCDVNEPRFYVGESMDRDMEALVRVVVKDMQWNRPVELMARNGRQCNEYVGFAAAKVDEMRV